MSSIYLINPRPDFMVYMGSEVSHEFGSHPLTFIADITITTVAAMIPKDFDIKLCDENIEDIDFNHEADFVGITGKFSQLERMKEIATEFHNRNKTVLIGGPLASLDPNKVRDYCDILVVGEIENIANKLFSDLKNHTWKSEYMGNKTNPIMTPIPRWELYSNQYAFAGIVQTSRGCPFNCEFCDVIQYAGRVQRHKPVQNVIDELNVLYKHDYRFVFLSDDNFTANRKLAKELLVAIRDWNKKLSPDRMFFMTQLSIDVAKDEELVQLCADAGMSKVFIGIESPSADALKEMNKVSNFNVDISKAVHTFLNHGISVAGGLILGFDTDTSETFDKMYDFAMSLPIPIWAGFSLMAPISTVLYKRLQKEKRINTNKQLTHVPWETNIIPKQMTNEELTLGTKKLIERLYSPEAFTKRVLNFINSINVNENLMYLKESKKFGRALFSIIRYWSRLGEKERKAFITIVEAIHKTNKPVEISQYFYQMLGIYLQTRYLLNNN